MKNPHPDDIAIITDLSNKLAADVVDLCKRMAHLSPMLAYLPTIYLHAARRMSTTTVLSLGALLAPGDEMRVSMRHERLIALVLCNLMAQSIGDDGSTPGMALERTINSVRMMSRAGLAPLDDAFLEELRGHLSFNSAGQRTAAAG